MAKILYIPNGPNNLDSIFPGLNFENVVSYTVSLVNNSPLTIIATTPLNEIEDCEDYIVLHWVNSLGGIDSIVLKLLNINQDSKSDSYQKPTTNPLIKSEHGINRFNVKINNLYQAEGLFQEEDMEWVEEIASSPFVWLGWEGIESQVDDYLPVVMVDKKTEVRKEFERYSYSIIFDFYLSHEKINIRG